MAAAWITIALSAAMNPWFSVTRNAFSDLGGPRAVDPWIYNGGMMVTAALLIAFSVYLLWSSGNRVESMGASFAAVGGIFLAMIGIFHEGTYPHVFVSTWFFAQMDMAIALWGPDPCSCTPRYGDPFPSASRGRSRGRGAREVALARRIKQ